MVPPEQGRFAASIETRGRFRLIAPDGADVTPVGTMPRAFLAVLALAPERRRSRDWLQRTLWPRGGEALGRGSVRAMLLKLDGSLGPKGALLGADRTDIWLQPWVRVDAGPPPPGSGPRLDGLSARSPAFARWLAALRRAGPGAAYALDPAAAPAPSVPGPAALHLPMRVLIDPTGAGAEPERLFLVSILADALSRRFTSHALADVHIGPDAPWDGQEAGGDGIRIEFSSAGSARRPIVHLRAVEGRGRRFLWSGRLPVTEDVETFVGRSTLGAFVSAAWTGITARRDGADPAPGLFLRTAPTRLFSGSHGAIMDAEAMLGTLVGRAADRGVPLAWLAFARLTRAVEFAAPGNALREEALGLASEAVAAAPTNPLVLALAASVQRQFGDDLGRGRFLARAAIRIDEHDPYAIEAVSSLELAGGALAAAYRSAIRARQAAQGLPNAFYWDMQVCLAALRMGDLETARRAAREVHAAQPGYRPALRYLAATSLLAGDRTAAGVWAARLAEREPGFTLASLRGAEYPVATLRLAGLADRLTV